jgi:hypothetical protein
MTSLQKSRTRINLSNRPCSSRWKHPPGRGKKEQCPVNLIFDLKLGELAIDGDLKLLR